MFAQLATKVRNLADHPYAGWWLFGYGIIESFLFPIPPDVILVALALSHPKQVQRYALIAALGSTVGGIVGYMIGRFGFDYIARPFFELLCTSPEKLVCPSVFVPHLEQLFEIHGTWLIGFSAMSSIVPYKLTILVAGLADMALVPFIVISFFVHWFRYAAISACVAYMGPKALTLAQQRLPLFFTIVGALALVIYAILYYY